jgi:hypothetical protein
MMPPLHAQGGIYSRALSPLDITTVHIIRTNRDPLTLKIEVVAASCGDTISTEWYSDVYIDFLSERPAGDSSRPAYRQYLNLSLFTLPSDDDSCDLDRVVEIELPEFIEMPDVPNRGVPSTEWDAILLVNDFATWFTLVDDTETNQSLGQVIDFGETELIRWQKVDSVVENLYSVGADPGILLPWFEGYHPDGCEAPTLVNLTRDPVESDNYTAEVFQLLPVDAICPAAIQPFVVTAAGVVPQRDLVLNFGETAYHVVAHDGLPETPVQRRYATSVITQIEPTDEGFRVQVNATAENYDVPINFSQAEIDGVTFLNIYYDVPAELGDSDKEITVEEVVNVPTLPIIVNGVLMSG